MIVTRQHAIVFCLGAIAAGTLLVTLGAAGDNPAPRYRLTSPWVAPDPSPGNTPAHGTYRLDTQTGEVYEIVGSNMHKVT